MLVQAISRMRKTSAKSSVTNSAAGVRPGAGTGLDGSTPMLRPLLSSGYARSRSRAMRATSSRACASVTPGLSRPLATIQTTAREVNACEAALTSFGAAPGDINVAYAPIGIQKSAMAMFVPVNPGLATPTIVNGSPLRRTVRPITPRSALNRRSHNE